MRAIRIGKILSALLMILLAYSCDSLLDVSAKGNITGNIYDSEEGIKSALNGSYFNLAGINDGVDGGELLGGDFILIPSLLIVESVFEMNWDDINGSAYSDFYERNILATNSRVLANWRRAYETINTLNSILMNLDNVSVGERDRIEGETLAMRAILYFEMARLWGPDYEGVGNPNLDVEVLPLLLDPVETPGASPTFNTVGDIYDQVLTDLTDASALLEDLGLNGTNISYYTCQAYLMRLAMHMDDYTAAIQHANNITDSGLFSLTSTPQEAFNNLTNSSEDIFAIQQTASYNSGNLSTGTGLVNYCASLTGQGLGAMRVSTFYLTDPFGDFDFSPDFSEVDLRGIIDESVSSTSTINDVNGNFYTNLLNVGTLSPSKYMSSDRVLPVIRLAEVLLTRAEASAYLSPSVPDPLALQDYNAIRMRAGLSELQSADFSNGIKLLDSIYLERRREFLYEGVLYHDMKRRKESINGISLDNERFSLPIPQSELDVR